MVAAGFGWSAGDIATAIRLVVKVGKAFKASGGATCRYNDALGFLQSLKVTLDHVGKHASRSSSDVYENDIVLQLDRITPHWKAFEAYLLRFEQSLGPTSSRSSLAKAPRTIQYTLKDLSGEVERLKTAVAQPLQVINTLLSLQLIQETRLLPQKLLTPAQCRQLVEAISLAGVPLALGDRLNHLEEAQRLTVDRATSTLTTQIRDSTNEHDASIGVTGPSWTSAVADNSSAPTSVSGTGRGNASNTCDFRLLVEEQHWGVIQLLRALSQQLDELQQTTSTTRAELRFCDSHTPTTFRQRPRMSPAVKSAANVVVSTMTASITTGIVVGKTIATTYVGQPPVPNTTVSSSTLLDTSPASSTGCGAESASSAGRVDLISQPTGDPPNAMGRPDQLSEPAPHAPSSQMNSLSEGKERSAPAESPRDSVLAPPEAGSHNNEMQYMGVKYEQLVVTLRHAGEDVAVPDLARAENAHVIKSIAESRVPECAPVDVEERASFYTPGRVFMTLWTASANEKARQSAHFAELPYIDASVGDSLRSAELRRFVVLRNEGPYSLCAPVYLGITFNHVRNVHREPYDIPIAMAEAAEDIPADDIADLALEVVPSWSTGLARVPKHSLLRLREVCMIEHSVRVVDIGTIAKDELALLEQLWRDANRDCLRPWLFEEASLDD